jgi:hypothetical protein
VLTVTKLWTRSFTLSYQDIFWEIGAVPANGTDLANHEIFNYEFFVLRSEAALGPYDVIGGPFRDLYTFRDSKVPALHKWRQFFYKLQVVDKRTSEKKDFGPTATKSPEPDLIAAEIQRQEDLLFREFSGRRCWLFPIRTFGPICSCFDKTMGRSTRSNHAPCFGTGWLGGFLSPVEVFVQIDPNAKQSVQSPNGQLMPSHTTARMSSFPLVNQGDILIESENRRWRVVNVQETQRLRSTVHQEFAVTEVPRSDIEYSIPLLVDAKALTPASERNFKNAQHVENDGDNKDILSFWNGKPRGVLR